MWSGLPFQQKRRRVLDELFDAHEEAHGVGAVHDAVVVGEGEVHHGTGLDLPVHDDGPLLDLVHAKDRHLRRVEDRGRDQRAEDAAVGDRERPALQVLQGQLALAGLAREVPYRPLDVGEALFVRVAHHGDDEALLGVYGDADVVVVLEDQLVPLELGVYLGEGLQGAYCSLDEEAHKAELDAVALLELLLAAASQLYHGAHVRLVEGGEHRRRLLRLDEPPRDGLAPSRHPYPLLQGAAAVLRSGRGPLLPPAVLLGCGLFRLPGGCVAAVLLPDQTLHVLASYASAGAAPGDLGEIDGVLLGELAHRGRSAYLLHLPVAVSLFLSLGFGRLGPFLFFGGFFLLGFGGGLTIALAD